MSEQIKTVVAMLQKEINLLREQIEKWNCLIIPVVKTNWVEVKAIDK